MIIAGILLTVAAIGAYAFIRGAAILNKDPIFEVWEQHDHWDY